MAAWWLRQAHSEVERCFPLRFGTPQLHPSISSFRFSCLSDPTSMSLPPEQPPVFQRSSPWLTAASGGPRCGHEQAGTPRPGIAPTGTVIKESPCCHTGPHLQTALEAVHLQKPTLLKYGTFLAVLEDAWGVWLSCSDLHRLLGLGKMGSLHWAEEHQIPWLGLSKDIPRAPQKFERSHSLLCYLLMCRGSCALLSL